MALQDFNDIKNQKYFIRTPFVLPQSVVNILPSQLLIPIQTFGGNFLKKKLFQAFGKIKRGQASDNSKVKSELPDDSVNDFNNKITSNSFNNFKKVQYLKLIDIKDNNIYYNLLLSDISFDTNFNNNLMFTNEGNEYFIERTVIENINYNVSFTFLSPNSTTFKNVNPNNYNISNKYNLSGLEHTPQSNSILCEDFMNQNKNKFIIFDYELLNMFGYLIVDTISISSEQKFKNLTEISVTGILTQNNTVLLKKIESNNNSGNQNGQSVNFPDIF